MRNTATSQFVSHQHSFQWSGIGSNEGRIGRYQSTHKNQRSQVQHPNSSPTVDILNLFHQTVWLQSPTTKRRVRLVPAAPRAGSWRPKRLEVCAVGVPRSRSRRRSWVKRLSWRFRCELCNDNQLQGLSQELAHLQSHRHASSASSMLTKATRYLITVILGTQPWAWKIPDASLSAL